VKNFVSAIGREPNFGENSRNFVPNLKNSKKIILILGKIMIKTRGSSELIGVVYDQKHGDLVSEIIFFPQGVEQLGAAS
jgi:hypothetical protein